MSKKSYTDFKLLAYALLFLSVGLLVAVILIKVPQQSSSSGSATTGLPADSSLRLTFVGDLMCHRKQFERARKRDGSYDFHPSFRWVRKYISQADLAFGNLETTFSGRESWRRYSGHPSFNSPDAYADAIKDAGFDVLFMANNHSLDYGEYGLKRTQSQLLDRGMTVAGTRDLQNEGPQFPLLIKKGISLAVLAYTQDSNSPASRCEDLSIWMLDTLQVEKDLKEARLRGAELVIVHFHYGKEYQSEPGAYQKKVVDHAIRHGADLVIGDHPHVLQPVQIVKSQSPHLDQGVVAYSLGNFLAHQFARYTNGGLMLTVEIGREPPSDQLVLKSVKVVPTYVTLPEGFPHTIFPAQLGMDDLSEELVREAPPQLYRLSDLQLKMMRQAFEDSRNLLLGRGSEIQLDTWF